MSGAQPLETWAQMRARHLREKRALVIQTVQHCEGNRTKAADLLGVRRDGLHQFVREQGLSDDLPAPVHWRRQR